MTTNQQFNLTSASTEKGPVRLCFRGGSFTGKTVSALVCAYGMTVPEGKRIAAIDTEARSMRKAKRDVDRILGLDTPFDVIDLVPPFLPGNFLGAIDHVYERADQYGVLVIDSATHFWKGILDYKASLDSGGGSKNSYVNWKPAFNQFDKIFHKIIYSPMDIIICLRKKEKFAIVRDGKTNKAGVESIGDQAEFRKDAEFDVDVVVDFEKGTHLMRVEKDRSQALENGALMNWEHGKLIKEWGLYGEGQAPAIQVHESAYSQSGGAQGGSVVSDQIVSALKSRGFNWPQIKTAMMKAGWSQEQVSRWASPDDLLPEEADWLLDNFESVISSVQ
jgi:hypothetical protein